MIIGQEKTGRNYNGIFDQRNDKRGTGKHESISEFRKRYAKNIDDCYIISQKDMDKKENINYLPVYLTPFLGK